MGEVRVASLRPLTKEEVPPNVWPAFDFASQELRDLISGKKALTIRRVCLTCGDIKYVLVSSIRVRLSQDIPLRGLCSSCRRSRARPDARGPRSCRWQGGRHITKDGYVLIYTGPGSRHGGGRYTLEHRSVMAQMLGRPLHHYEQVHHKNGNKTDNRTENLELWTRGQHPTGTRTDDQHCPGCRCFEVK